MMKIVMNTYYVHKSNWKELLKVLVPSEIRTLVNVMENTEGDFNYEVIKFDRVNHKISFIDSPDWDTANEPIVGDSHVYDIDNDTIIYRKGREKNPQIYHNKWMFVSNDYKGFDIDKAKQRTELWNSIPNIDKKRIGNRDYWVELLAENNIEI